MHWQRVHLVGLALALSLGWAARGAGQGVTNDVDVIEFGLPRSTLIVSGKFLDTFSGGGGATSTVKVDRVFRTPVNFQSATELQVYWTTRKPHDLQVQMGTNTFLFFLQSAERGPTEYRDVTGTYPFVPASQTNVQLLLSKLKEKK